MTETVTAANWRYCNVCGYYHESSTAGCSVGAGTNFAPPPRQAQQPFACPVCSGHKTISKPPWVAGDQHQWAVADFASYPCPACSATGIVWGPPL
jgi:hypothetical protein